MKESEIAKRLHETRMSPEYAAVLARQLTKYVLSILWAVAFFAALFGTNLASSFGGTAKDRVFVIGIATGLPFFAAYFPLAWLAARTLRQRLSKH